MARFLLLILLGLLGTAGAEESPTSLKDRDFYQELNLLGERQDAELSRYREATHSLPPAERLRRRRLLMISQRREMALLESRWRDRISPDQRRRWLERRQDRKRRLETLQHQQTAAIPSSSSRLKTEHSGIRLQRRIITPKSSVQDTAAGRN